MSVRDTVRSGRLTVVEFPLDDRRKVWIRAFSSPARAQYTRYIADAKESGEIKPEVVAAMGISEQDGTLVYDWRKPEDLLELVEHFDVHVLDAIGLKLLHISGLTEKAIEEAEKN